MADETEQKPLTVAEVHRKYDAEFCQLMLRMTRELNAAIEHDPIRSLELNLNTETLASTGADRRIMHITLVDASISMNLTYG